MIFVIKMYNIVLIWFNSFLLLFSASTEYQTITFFKIMIVFQKRNEKEEESLGPVFKKMYRPYV